MQKLGGFQQADRQTSKHTLYFHFTGVDDDLIRPNRRPGVTKGQIEFSTKTPHLILTLLPTDRLESPNKKNRKKRAAADATTCSRYEKKGVKTTILFWGHANLQTSICGCVWKHV